MYTITLTTYSSTYTYAHKYSIHVCGICGAIAMCMNSIYVPLLSYSLPLPISQDDAFEDSVVDFFETADTNRYEVIEYEDLYNVSIIIIIIIDLFHCWLLHVVYVSFLHQLFFSSLFSFWLFLSPFPPYTCALPYLQLLASPLVASRVYRSQMEQLLGLYHTYTASTGGRMGLAEFSAVAGSLLLMIYQNAYPDMVYRESLSSPPSLAPSLPSCLLLPPPLSLSLSLSFPQF